jgi:hypothetical protein
MVLKWNAGEISKHPLLLRVQHMDAVSRRRCEKTKVSVISLLSGCLQYPGPLPRFSLKAVRYQCRPTMDEKIQRLYRGQGVTMASMGPEKDKNMSLNLLGLFLCRFNGG